MPCSPNAMDVAVGYRIAARRSAMGLSQSVLAQRIGISPQQVQKYEAGSNRISASRLAAIAAALGIAPGALFPETSVVASPAADEAMAVLRFMTASAEGRTVATAFPQIRDRAVRQALARITEALAPAA